MMNRIQMLLAVVATSLAVTAPAYAFRGGGDMTNMSTMRRELASPKDLKLVRIEGALTCDLGAENTGQGCDLKLHEAKTGKIYNLIEARTAMLLFQDGNKKVVIEGHLADSETIEVKDAQTL